MLDPDELKPLLISQELPEQSLTPMKNHSFLSNDHGSLKLSPKTEEEVESLNKMREEEALALNKISDDFAEKFRKYNVPRLGESKEFEGYADYFKDFMKIWKVEAEKGRGKGHRSLIEWLQKLDHDHNKQRSTSLNPLKVMAINLGIQISQCITDFSLLNSVSAESSREVVTNIRLLAILLGGLSLEENSIIIDKLVSVMKFFDQTLRMAEPVSVAKSSKGNSSQRELQQNILCMLLGQVLRLEIAFCCPDFPVMLNNDAFLNIRCQLSQIFGEELKKINLKINELKSEILPRGNGSRTMNLIRERLNVGIRDIWKELDLKSGADQTN